MAQWQPLAWWPWSRPALGLDLARSLYKSTQPTPLRTSFSYGVTLSNIWKLLYSVLLKSIYSLKNIKFRELIFLDQVAFSEYVDAAY